MRVKLFASIALLTVLVSMPMLSRGCPFCSAVSMTFCEEIGQTDVAVFAKLVGTPPPSNDESQNASSSLEPSKFQIIEVLKGADLIGKEKFFETLYFGAEPIGKEFLVMAINEKPKLAWATPITITPAVKPYIKTALTLPKEGADRLVFFQDYLEGTEEMLARDAYDEFAKAPYKDVVGLKGRMKHDQLVAWIKDPKVTASHRRLYLTMLGVCGTKKDADMLEEMLKDDGPAGKSGMDALAAAYLTLKGPDGVALIEDEFLKNKDAEYTETYAAIMAIRFHGQEETIIPKQRLIQALRYMLDRPQLADLVIPDLARWEDWGSMDKLVQLFKDSEDDTGWVRVPVINFLRACPLPGAKKHLEELAKIDPESVKRANSFFPLGGGVAPAAEGKKPEAAATKDEPSAEAAEDEVPDASKFVDPGDRAAVEQRRPQKRDQAAMGPVSRVGATAVLLNKNSGDRPGAPSTRTVLMSTGGVCLLLFAVMAALVRGGQHSMS
jgi:hypothetical protein